MIFIHLTLLKPPLEITIPSRTYSTQKGGTFGYEIFAVKNINLGEFYQSLIHLKENDKFVTNIEIVNIENYPLEVKIKLYNNGYEFIRE